MTGWAGDSASAGAAGAALDGNFAATEAHPALAVPVPTLLPANLGVGSCAPPLEGPGAGFVLSGMALADLATAAHPPGWPRAGVPEFAEFAFALVAAASGTCGLRLLAVDASDSPGAPGDVFEPAPSATEGRNSDTPALRSFRASVSVFSVSVLPAAAGEVELDTADGSGPVCRATTAAQPLLAALFVGVIFIVTGAWLGSGRGLARATGLPMVFPADFTAVGVAASAGESAGDDAEDAPVEAGCEVLSSLNRPNPVQKSQSSHLLEYATTESKFLLCCRVS